jgi:hypothetical protein
MGIRSVNNSVQEFLDTFLRSGDDAAVQAENLIQASGGVVSEYTDPGPGTIYRSHIFTSSGALVVNSGSGTADVLIVGGGGGGGFDRGGGGGGGAFVELTNQSITPGSKTVTINAGGAGAVGSGSQGGDGGTTTFDTTTVKGGGGGGTNASTLM